MLQCKCRRRNISPVDITLIDVLSCRTVQFPRCQCMHWAGRLFAHGFFPTKANPKVALSLTLLEMFQCFSTTGSGGFSKQGFANGLKAFHRIILRREPLATYEKMFRGCFPFYLRVREARDEALFNVLNRRWERTWREEYGQAFAPADRETDSAGTPAPSTTPMQGGIVATSANTPGPTTPSLDATRLLPSASSIQLGRPFRLELGSYNSICSACFHRDHRDNSPIVTSLDGNFQHSRWIHVSPGGGDGRQTIFFHVPSWERERVRDNEAETEKDEAKEDHVAGTICEHNFKATSKPKSMTQKDETGLLMIVCR
ncbi:hypothetical protein BJ508DRAFT_316274 [Ascobolus immersus RN42]|uniref:CxC1-like cysteine cluster associated with KDZ transposases domain-containing protein n=1 Tax=Ascobolus immersus RN42 TaxID=1160509 RepID=A0A3N4HEX1_ASCIM|nr:hypothetical protein BJ508DRAFT_316274 [Ascobolus immersus RN42]